MKLIYCHCSVYNPGGMERVLLNKLQWFVAHRPDWEIVLVTTDQQGRPPFFKFPPQVRMVDLGINYSQGNGAQVFKKVAGFIRKRRLHRHRLTELLMREKADIVVSLFPSESSFIPDIEDGSKKVLELHFNRNFRLQYGRSGVIGLLDKILTARDAKLVRRFDSFVVLTHEDTGLWGALPNMSVIPNAAMTDAQQSDCESNRVIAVGRLDYQKGFDRLIEAWEKVAAKPNLSHWHLDIYGQGEWRQMLEEMVRQKNLQNSVTIHQPVKEIVKEYTNASVLAMTSHYEGFPMVMIEAMSCGVPVVTFDFQCGPKDIVNHGVNGMIVPDGDIDAFAEPLAYMLENEQVRKRMGSEAMKVKETFSQERVMSRWSNLFESLVKDA